MEIFLIIIISLAIGSFASCISYRLGEGESWVFTRSKCVKCNVTLDIKNLVPIFSWIFQGRKCSKCKSKISLRYPLTEIFFPITFLIIFYFSSQIITTNFILLCAISSILIIMSIIDIEKYFIPDIMQLILLILAIIFAFKNEGATNLAQSFFAAFALLAFSVALYFAFYITTKQAALGVDDMKLLFSIGLMIGFSKFLVFTFLAGIFGIIFGSIWIKLKKDDAFPFAPALCLSLFVCLLINKNFSLEKAISSILF